MVPFKVDLSEEVIAITGAGGVLMSAFAKALAECGASIGIIDLKLEPGQKVADEITAAGGKAVAVAANCLSKDEVVRAKADIEKALGPVTMLINGAGGNNPACTTDNETMAEAKAGMKTFFDLDNAPFSNMVLGEVLNRPGKWSSYPPHHHPQPEVYFYRFDYPHGFGAGFANGDVYKTEQNGCAVINHGFHSQVVAPGYAMCYAWGIRHLEGDPWLKTRIDDKEHEWLWKPDANDHIYPNH